MLSCAGAINSVVSGDFADPLCKLSQLKQHAAGSKEHESIDAFESMLSQARGRNLWHATSKIKSMV